MVRTPTAEVKGFDGTITESVPEDARPVVKVNDVDRRAMTYRLPPALRGTFPPSRRASL